MCKKILFLLSATLMSTQLFAAEDLLDAYRAGLKNDARFQVAHYQYEAAREAIPQAFAGLLPVVSLEGRKGKQEQEILERDNPFFGVGKSDFPTSYFVFQVNQPIYHRASWLRLSQSKAFVRQSFALYAAAEQAFILRTAEAYLNVLSARDNLKFSKTEQVSIARQVKLIEARRRGGLAIITDEYEAKARSARVEADVIASEYALDDAFQALREVAGDAMTDVAALKAEIPMLEPDPLNVQLWVDKAVEQNFDLIARKEAVNVAEQEIRRRRASHLPNLDLVARHSNTETGGAVTGGGSDVNNTEVTLQLTVPIYSGGAVRSQTREAQFQYRQAQEERKLQHLTAMRETRAAFQGVRSSISRVSAFAEAIRSLQSALDGKTKGYGSGVNTLLEVLDAERELTATRRDHARARYDYLLNILRLKQQTGTLGEVDLTYINEMLVK